MTPNTQFFEMLEEKWLSEQTDPADTNDEQDDTDNYLPDDKEDIHE